jgi:hypothetical protein
MHTEPTHLAASNHPITGEPTNLQRALWADAAIHTFLQRTGCDLEDGLGDLLCDLMHWSSILNFDFDAALERARSHFEVEAVPPTQAS